MSAATDLWFSIGAGSRDDLEQTAKKIQSKWAGRYDLEVVPRETAQEGAKETHTLRLKHR